MVPEPPARVPWSRVLPLKTPLAFSLALLLGLASGSTEAAEARRGASTSAPKSKKAPRARKRTPSPKPSPAPTEAPAPEQAPVEARTQAPAPVAPAEPVPVPATPPPVTPAPAPPASRVTAASPADAPRVDDTRLLPPPPPASLARGETRPTVLSVVKKPWFWAAVGGVAVATTAGFLLASQPSRPPLGVRLGNPGAGW